MNMESNYTKYPKEIKSFFNRLEAKSRVYAHSDDIRFVKVDFPEIGLYINSITVRWNPKNPAELWVQMPKFRSGKPKWHEPLEFQTFSPLRRRIVEEAINACYIEDCCDPGEDEIDWQGIGQYIEDCAPYLNNWDP